MKPMYIISCLWVAMAALGCKKDSTEGYYNGTWNLREQSYSTPDTNYTETLPAGTFTYTFTSNGNVHIVHTGVTDVHDTWELQTNSEDSLRFGSGISWGIQEKTEGRFKAKFYPTASAFWLFTLEK